MVGPNGKVIGAVSGGVDSTVAAALLHRAIGNRFHVVMVDNGCLRKDEGKIVVDRLRNKLGINLTLIDASDKFLTALDGVSDPELKRKTIGRLFIEVFQEEATKIGSVNYLLQGAHTYMHACMHAYVQTYTLAYVHTCMHTAYITLTGHTYHAPNTYITQT